MDNSRKKYFEDLKKIINSKDSKLNEEILMQYYIEPFFDNYVDAKKWYDENKRK